MLVPNHPNTSQLVFQEKKKNTKVLSEVVKLRYGGNYGLDADPVFLLKALVKCIFQRTPMHKIKINR